MLSDPQAYSRYLTVMLFADAINRREWEPMAKAAITQVCEFYMVNSILEGAGAFLQVSISGGLECVKQL